MAVVYTAKLNMPKADDGTRPWGVYWRTQSDDMEARLAAQRAGNPNTFVAGYWVGMLCFDTTNSVMYVCTTATGVAATTVWTVISLVAGVGLASTTEVLTGTDASKAVTADALAALWEKAADVASAATVVLGEGGYFNVTGNTAVTDIDFGTDKAGRAVWLRFPSAGLVLTHSATLICLNATSITTEAGDMALFISEAADTVRMLTYTRATGASISGFDISTLATKNDPAYTAYVAGSIGAGVSNNRKIPTELIGGWSALDTQTASASSTIDFSLTAWQALGFDDFEVLVSGLIPTTDNTDLWIRLSHSGAYASGVADYAWACAAYNSSGAINQADDSDSEIQVNGTTNLGNNTNEQLTANFRLQNAASTTRNTSVTWFGGYYNALMNASAINGWGQRQLAQDCDGIQFRMSSGTIASGEFILMGRRRVTT